ncbi:death-on-curing protein [Brumimicrobium oceani]|uniref:Death-on-curing protein n=1 Tax=Brumimicrobium oceani TaxID=2100725 RepID=A0A2U2XEL3_9FLAO|nr:death-on-curing protein [Brumimicrobium oceani]PWH86187.1 death-on-curing protein [Brumimicrobium oceani]
MQENNSQIIIYQTESGDTKLDVRFQDETVWLTQKMMADLFQSSVPNVNMHLKNIFEEGELEENRTIKDFLIVQKEVKLEARRQQVFLILTL